jgi:hypothetical protein
MRSGLNRSPDALDLIPAEKIAGLLFELCVNFLQEL